MSSTARIDPDRRRRMAATSAPGGAGLVATSVPFVSSKAPSERARTRGAAAGLGVTVLHVPTGRAPLEVAVEPDAVGRIELDALHLAAQPFALGQ